MKLVFNILAILMTFIAGCGLERPSFDSLLTREPRVVSVEPQAGSVVKGDSIVSVEFSEPISPSSVDPTSLAIVKADNENLSGTKLAQSIADGDVSGVDGSYSFENGGRVVIFQAAKPYEAGMTYGIVATYKIMSIEMIPLNQRIGSTNRAFVSEFSIWVDEAGPTDVPEDETGLNDNASGVGGSQPSSTDEIEDTSGASSQPERPSRLVINEVLYDATGDDTDGVEFIELAGDAGGDVSGYKLLLIDGDSGEVKETIEIPENTLIPPDGVLLIADSRTGQSGISQIVGADIIDNFDPPNGPDCIQLVEEGAQVIDALGYGAPIISKAKNGVACFEGTPAPKTSSGKSLSRSDTIDTDDNSLDFKILPIPTPGVM